MKNTFGTETTTLTNKSTLETTVSKLSDQASVLLSFVLDKLEESELLGKNTTLDERGVYVEHDSGDCKPFATKVVKELVKSGLVMVHPESGDGVHFLSTNSDVMWEAQRQGLHTVYDLVP